MEALATLDAANVLLSAPAFNAPVREVCARLRSGDATADRSLIGVTFTQTPDQWLASRFDPPAGRPPDVWLVCVGEQARSTVASDVPTADAGADVSIRTVSSPGNLTKLGVALTECLPAAAPTDSSRTASLCFESVGTLLQHANPRSVFQFFQVLTDHVSAHGVTAHYHVDPTAVSEQDFNRLAVLFDAVIELSEGGDVSVRTR